MKRLLLLVASVVVLAGCVDTGIPTPGNGVGREGWWTTPPDSEGNRFECFYWSLKDSTAMWCKDEPVKP